MSIFANLPLELVNLILSYGNVIRCRNGKYINQIAEDDTRKVPLQKIPLKYYLKWPDDDIISTVVLHVNATKYIAINYKNYILTISINTHSGIDYKNPEPGDEDESTQLISVINVQIQ